MGKISSAQRGGWYSLLSNRRPGSFINFWEIVPLRSPYFRQVVYLFLVQRFVKSFNQSGCLLISTQGFSSWPGRPAKSSIWVEQFVDPKFYNGKKLFLKFNLHIGLNGKGCKVCHNITRQVFLKDMSKTIRCQFLYFHLLRSLLNEV